MNKTQQIQELRRSNAAQPHRNRTRYYRPDANAEADDEIDEWESEGGHVDETEDEV